MLILLKIREQTIIAAVWATNRPCEINFSADFLVSLMYKRRGQSVTLISFPFGSGDNLAFLPAFLAQLAEKYLEIVRFRC